MNILIVSQYFSPENLPVNFIAKALKDNGYSVDVLTGKPNYPKGRFFKGYNFFSKINDNVSGIKVFRLPVIPRGNRFRTIGLVLNYISFVFFGCLMGPFVLRKQKYDVIFIYANSPITKAIPAILIGKIRKIPIILWVQDLWPESFVATGYKLPNFLIYFLEKIVKHIYKNVDLILGQSNSFVAKIKKDTDISENKFGYLPNTIDNIFLEKSHLSNRLPKSLENLKGDFNIMFTGNIGEAQSVGTILKAAKILDSEINNRINFILVGGGSKIEYIRKVIADQKIDNIQLMGQHPIEKMPLFIDFCDVLLITLKKEKTFELTIPNKLQAYLASGKPILGSIDGEGANVIIKANAGIVVDSEDYKSLSDSAKKLSLMNKKNLEIFGKNGVNYFEENFCVEKFISKLSGYLRKQVENYSKK